MEFLRREFPVSYLLRPSLTPQTISDITHRGRGLRLISLKETLHFRDAELAFGNSAREIVCEAVHVAMRCLVRLVGSLRSHVFGVGEPVCREKSHEKRMNLRAGGEGVWDPEIDSPWAQKRRVKPLDVVRLFKIHVEDYIFFGNWKQKWTTHGSNEETAVVASYPVDDVEEPGERYQRTPQACVRRFARLYARTRCSCLHGIARSGEAAVDILE